MPHRARIWGGEGAGLTQSAHAILLEPRRDRLWPNGLLGFGDPVDPDSAFVPWPESRFDVDVTGVVQDGQLGAPGRSHLLHTSQRCIRIIVGRDHAREER